GAGAGASLRPQAATARVKASTAGSARRRVQIRRCEKADEDAVSAAGARTGECGREPGKFTKHLAARRWKKKNRTQYGLNSNAVMYSDTSVYLKLRPVLNSRHVKSPPYP